MSSALVLGALLPLAFAPFAVWPLAFVIPALLLFALQRSSSARNIFLSGWFFGTGYFGFGVYWIYNSLHDFGMAPPLVAGGITGLLVAYLALGPALTFVSWHYSRRFLGDTSLWLLPLFWFSFEWFRGWFFTGMPWLSLGYSQTASPLSGFAPLIGVYGISALCLFMAVALFLLLRDRRYSMLAILLLVPLSGYLLQQIDWTEAQPQSIKVSMVQGNIPQAVKWRRDQRHAIFNTYWRETRQLWDSDLIIWPETALPGQSEDIESTMLQPLQQAAIDHDTHILAGLVVNESEPNRYYNSMILLGQERSLYHKRHLVIFGEYYPMRWLLDLLSGVINIPFSDMTPGPADQETMSIGDSQLGVSICFEDVFSRDIMLDLPAANLLVNLSNDAWFGNSTAPHQHQQIAQMRSLETERVMMRSTNTGVSAFIDHKGRVLKQSEQFKTQSITDTVQGRIGSTPFLYFHKVQWLLSLFPFALLFMLARRKAG